MLGIYCRTSRERDTEISTIIQQRTAGIKFAEKNKFEYQLYEDEGKSGYKISDDDKDPFNNRPAFTDLINDIKNGKINKIWVWEHSRLSRNQFASAFIFNIFEKYNIILYENNKEFKLDDPQIKFNRQILDAVSEYERHLIVARITRGLRKRIDEGKRTHNELYGYRKEGKDANGYTIWVSVESEIENYKYIFKRYMDGASLRKISFEIYDVKKIETEKLVTFATRMGAILRKYQYTGFQLTIEGYDIFKRFRKNEIDNLNILSDRKYWVKSSLFPLEIISIEDWITVCEKLQARGKLLNIGRKDRLLRASSDIATGLIECGGCGIKYYYHELKSYLKKTREQRIYITYFHMGRFKDYLCYQRPKSFRVHHINEIFKLYYFYVKLVFDNKNELTKESQRTIKQTQIKLKEAIARTEKRIITTENRIAKFNKFLDKTEDINAVELLSERIVTSNKELNELNIELSKYKIDFEIENEKFNQTLLEMTYYDVKEKINDWFYNMNIEEQRNELIRTIKACKIFSHYMIIDSGKVVFFFDIYDHHVFNMELLENLNKDEVYKLYFTTMKNIRQAKTHNQKRIADIDFEKDKDRRSLVFLYLIEKFNISYNLNDTSNFVSFVSLRGLFSQNEENE